MAVSVLPFLDRSRSYIAVWSGEDECVLEVFGERIHVPSTDDVANFGSAGSKYRFPPAKDAAGKPIPGTVVLSDKWVRDNQTQEEFKQFDAEKFLTQLHARNGALLARGLTVVADVDQVEAAREAGKPKWLKAKAAEWETTVRQELERQEMWARKGQPAPTSSSAQSVKIAIAGLKTIRQKLGEVVEKSELLEALGHVVETPFKATPTAEEEVVDIGKAADDLFAAAEAAGITLTKPELKGLLSRDEAVLEQVAEKLRTA